MTVHPAVGKQAHEVERRIVSLDVPDRCQELFVVKKAAVFDRFGDAGEFLVHDAAGADVQVAYFGVAHLAVGQTDIFPGRA